MLWHCGNLPRSWDSLTDQNLDPILTYKISWVIANDLRRNLYVKLFLNNPWVNCVLCLRLAVEHPTCKSARYHIDCRYFFIWLSHNLTTFIKREITHCISTPTPVNHILCDSSGNFVQMRSSSLGSVPSWPTWRAQHNLRLISYSGCSSKLCFWTIDHLHFRVPCWTAVLGTLDLVRAFFWLNLSANSLQVVRATIFYALSSLQFIVVLCDGALHVCITSVYPRT